MPDPAERSAISPNLDIRFSPVTVARARRTLDARRPAEFNLPLFTLIAGLLAGRLRRRPPSKLG